MAVDYSKTGDYGGEDAPVIRHAPDDDNYHLATDMEQLRQMGVGRVGRCATIPKANINGTSKGFNHNEPTLVTVDPEYADRVVFDPKSANNREIKAAIASSRTPQQVYQQLSRPLTKEAQETPVDPIPFPNLPAPVMLQPAPAQQPFMPQPLSAMTPPMTASPPPVYPQQQPLFQQPSQTDYALQHITQAVNAINQRLFGLEQRAVAPATPVNGKDRGPSRFATQPVELQSNGSAIHRQRIVDEIVDEVADDGSNGPVPPVRRRQPRTLIDDAEETAAAPLARPTGFETLGLPWVDGPTAKKPKYAVFFELPGAGKTSARYHDVIVSPEVIALVYDVRFDSGTQYMPPDLASAPIKLTVPGAKDQKISYTVTSQGLTFSLGTFDIIVLIRDDASPDTSLDGEVPQY